MDAESDDPARILIHDDKDRVRPQCRRLAKEQVDTPETVLEVSNEGQPGRAANIRFGSVVAGENPPNNVLIDLDAERQGDLLRDARTAPGWSAIRYLDYGFNQFLAGSLGSGLTSALG